MFCVYCATKVTKELQDVVHTTQNSNIYKCCINISLVAKAKKHYIEIVRCATCTQIRTNKLGGHAIKKLLALVLVACLALSMVACGAASSSTVVSSTASSTGAEPVTLTYWSMWNATEPQAVVIQEAIDAYQAETGNTVNVEWKGRDISTLIQAALDAGEKIDMFDEDYQRIGTQYAASCMELEDMAKAAGYDDFAVAALPTAIRRWAGSLKAIAYQPYTSGIYYNKAIFAEAGIEAEPTTWAELMDACEKIKAAGYAPFAQDDAYVRYTFGFVLDRYIGQEAISAMVQDGTWAENEGALKAAEAVADMVNKGYFSESCPAAYPDGENEIGFEETAMVVNASWVPGEITNNTGCDLEWGMFNFPTMDGGKDPATVANVGAQAFAIPAASENGQAAFDLIMKITTGEFDQKMALDSNGIPADTRNTEWPEMIAGGRDAFNALTDVYDWNMGLNDNADMKETLQANCLKLFEGSFNGQQFIDAMQAAYK